MLLRPIQRGVCPQGGQKGFSRSAKEPRARVSDKGECSASARHELAPRMRPFARRLELHINNPLNLFDAECGARQMLQLACKEPVTLNRRRGPFPFESAVPGFAEYLRSERGFAESTIRNYRRHRSEFAQYFIQTGVTSFSQLSPPVLAAFVVEQTLKMAPRTHAPRSLLSFASDVAVLSPRENHESVSQRSRRNSTVLSPRRRVTFHHLG